MGADPSARGAGPERTRFSADDRRSGATPDPIDRATSPLVVHGMRRIAVGEALVIAAILLAAAAFRLDRIASLPPGLFQDEAVYGVNAETILNGTLHIYYGEREPLFEYLAAFVMLLLGRTPLALRVTAATVGLVGVAAGGAFARQLFGRRIGLLAAAGLASSLWLTTISRVGFRAITFPTVECLGLALLWRATRTGRGRDFALSGAVLGLSLYTYLASRLLPFALVAFVVVSMILQREWMRKQLRGFVIAAATAVVVCLPLGAYALRHPEMLTGRPDQVALPGGAAFYSALIANVPRTLGMLLFHGDENWRQNFSGAPVFDPLNGVVFLVGLVVALRWRSPSALLALILAVVMLVPSMLSIDSPHYLRTEGAAAAIYAIWALGLVWLADGVAGRVSRPAPTAVIASSASPIEGPLPRAFDRPRGKPRAANRTTTERPTADRTIATDLHPNLASGPAGDRISLVASSVIAIAVVVAFARTGWTYFVDYARNPAVLDAFSADLAAAGRFLSASPIWLNDRANVFITDDYEINRGSIAFFLYPRLTPAERPGWLDERNIGTFFAQDSTIPLPVVPSVYVVAGDGQTTIDSLGPAVQRTAWIQDGSRHAGRAIWAAPASADWFGEPVGASFGRWLELERVVIRSTTVGLRWRILAIPSYQPSIYVHVVDGQDHTLATADQVVGFAIERWRVGQEFVTWHPIHLPPGTAPATFKLSSGVYRKETGEREPAVVAGHAVGDVLLGQLALTEPVRGSVTISHRIDRPIAAGLDLIGYDLARTEVEAGELLPLTLAWQAIGERRPALEATVSLRSADGAVVGAWQGPVGGPNYPTDRWPSGTTIRQLIDVPVGATATGTSTLSVTVGTAGGQPSSAGIVVGTVAVKASSHQFIAPRPQHSLNAAFVGVGALIGYDLPDREYLPGQTVPLTLYWKSAGNVPTRYTVFVHLLDSRNRVVGQRDEPPVHGSRPTTSWIAGEYLADAHEVPLDAGVAPGTYQIEVGLYDPRNGQRVATGTPDNRVLIGSVRVGKGPGEAQH